MFINKVLDEVGSGIVRWGGKSVTRQACVLNEKARNARAFRDTNDTLAVYR